MVAKLDFCVTVCLGSTNNHIIVDGIGYIIWRLLFLTKRHLNTCTFGPSAIIVD